MRLERNGWRSGLGFYLWFVVNDLLAPNNKLVPFSVLLAMALTTGYSTVGLAIPEWSEKSRKLEISRSASLSLTLVPGFGQGVDGYFLDQLYRELDPIATEHLRLLEPFVQQDFKIQFPGGHPQNGRRISARLIQDGYLWRGLRIAADVLGKLAGEENGSLRAYCEKNHLVLDETLKDQVLILLPNTNPPRDRAWWLDIVYPDIKRILGPGFSDNNLRPVPDTPEEWSFCLNGKRLAGVGIITDTLGAFPKQADSPTRNPKERPSVIISADLAKILGTEMCAKGSVINLSTPNTPDFFPSLEFEVAGVLDDSQPSPDYLYFRLDEVSNYLEWRRKGNIPVERIIATKVPRNKSAESADGLNRDPEFQAVMRNYGLRKTFASGDALVFPLEDEIPSRDKYLWETRIQPVASKVVSRILGEGLAKGIQWQYVEGKGDPTESGYSLSPRSSKYEIFVQSVESLSKVEKAIQNALAFYKEFKWQSEQPNAQGPKGVKLFDPPTIGNTDLIRQVEEVEKSFSKAQKWMNYFVLSSFLVLFFVMVVLYFLRFEQKKAEISLLKVIGNSPIRLAMLPVIQGLVLGALALFFGGIFGLTFLQAVIVGGSETGLGELSGFWLEFTWLSIAIMAASVISSWISFYISTCRPPAALINEH